MLRLRIAWPVALAHMPVLALALVGAGCAVGQDLPVVVVGFRAAAAVEVPGAVMVSPDGERWEPPAPLGERGEWITEIAAQGNRFAAIGLKGGLYLSDPSGHGWRREQVHRSWLDAVYFPGAIAPGVGFLAGADLFLRTDDAGASWKGSQPPGLYFEDLAFRSGEDGVGVAGFLVPSRGLAWRTTNGGVAWTQTADTATGLRAVASPDPSGEELWAAGNLGLVLVSTNGGSAWTDVSGPTRIDPLPDFTDIDFAGPDAGWLVGSHGAARSFRGAALPAAHRWTHGSAGDIYLQGVFAVDRDHAYACGYRTFTDHGVVVRTQDGGRSWDVVAETPGIFWYGIAGRREGS